MKKILIIDVSSYIFRAYHAIPPLKNSEGEQVNAIYGFVSMFLKLSREFSDFAVIAALDTDKRTFRKEKYDEYKANRKEVDEELKLQFKYIEPMLKALNIPALSKEGFEADDIIATCSKKFSDKEIVIVSSDKDLMQLINDRIVLFDSMKNRIIDTQAVIDKFQVPPEKIRDLLSLMGDSSDNIPGVPGIGLKTGATLLDKYDTIEGIYNNLKDLSPKQREKLSENREKLELSKELVTLIEDVQISELEISPWSDINSDEFVSFASHMGFKTILKKMGLADQSSLITQVPDFTDSEITMKKKSTYFILQDAKKHLYIAEDKKYMPVTLDEIPQKCTLIGFDMKDYLPYPFPSELQFFDLQIAYYITDSGRHSYTLKNIADHFGINLADDASVAAQFAVFEEIYNKVTKRFKEHPSFQKLLDTIELPNLNVLKGMETYGIGVDLKELKTMRTHFTEKLQSIEEQIRGYAGEELNINSPKQLRVVLFEKLGLPVIKKTKTGPSTNQDVLEKLKEYHPLPELILEHRQYAKLLSTYIEPISKKTCDDGKLHSTFIVTHTATGRLASRDPNLQNIPVRTEEGKKIRSLFTASPDYSFISLDYSQIELRILAELSKDEELISAFNNGDDIHKKTASAIFNVFPEMVDDTMRQHAKAVNFGIIYGMQAFKLSQDTGVQISFAKEYIDHYFRFYTGVKEFIDNTVSFAKKNEYVETLYGRRRYIPEINHKNKNTARSGERIAVNTIIQGSAADIIKLGTIHIHDAIRSQNLDAKVLLQIHDELIIEVPSYNAQMLASQFEKILKKVVPEFSVPLEVNYSIGTKWSDLK